MCVFYLSNQIHNQWMSEKPPHNIHSRWANEQGKAIKRQKKMFLFSVFCFVCTNVPASHRHCHRHSVSSKNNNNNKDIYKLMVYGTTMPSGIVLVYSAMCTDLNLFRWDRAHKRSIDRFFVEFSRTLFSFGFFVLCSSFVLTWLCNKFLIRAMASLIRLADLRNHGRIHVIKFTFVYSILSIATNHRSNGMNWSDIQNNAVSPAAKWIDYTQLINNAFAIQKLTSHTDDALVCPFVLVSLIKWSYISQGKYSICFVCLISWVLTEEQANLLLFQRKLKPESSTKLKIIPEKKH